MLDMMNNYQVDILKVNFTRLQQQGLIDELNNTSVICHTDNLVYINTESKDCDTVEELCLFYIGATNDQRVFFKKNTCSDIFLNAIYVLDDIIECQNCDKLLDLLKKQGVDPVLENQKELEYIAKYENDHTGWGRNTYSFLYGYICGKRAERAKKK